MRSEDVDSKEVHRCVLAVDPGRKKCGLAVVDSVEGILFREVVPCREFSQRVRDVYHRFQPSATIMGGSTGFKEIAKTVEQALGVTPEEVDERHSTEQAKLRYFQEFPPRGLWKLVPLGLQTPPVCYDDFAAVVLAERWLRRRDRNEI